MCGSKQPVMRSSNEYHGAESLPMSIKKSQSPGIQRLQHASPNFRAEKMTAAQALDLYKGRDASEKLFRGDKSYLGNKSFRVHTSESVHAKIFIEFVALIIRSRFYTCLKEQMQKGGKKNYMTVPAAIRELEKIELIRQSDRGYRMDYAVTAAQKEILKAFHMTAANIRIQAAAINEDLMKIEKEG